MFQKMSLVYFYPVKLYYLVSLFGYSISVIIITALQSNMFIINTGRSICQSWPTSFIISFSVDFDDNIRLGMCVNK